jgi:CubicO group peptidase (beta-lactamase class C family)
MNRIFPTRSHRRKLVPVAAFTLAALVFGADHFAARQALEPVAVARFAGADQAASALPRLRSLLVSHRGELEFEEYYNGSGPDSQANMKSASKSLMSAFIGIAIGQGVLTGVDQPIGEFFPDLLAGAGNAAKREITIGDLLTMRSGLETTSNRNYGAWVVSSNWVRHALHMPMVDEPGGGMIYSTGSTHILSAILTRVSGKGTWEFANEHFARPQGYALNRWMRDPQGIYFGGNEMTLTSRQLLGFGELYLNGGRAPDGAQVVPEDWVRRSFVARTPSPREPGRFYGYGWWVRAMAGHAVFYGWGYGGQFVFVVPTLDLVVAATSDPNPGDDRRGHLGAIYRLVENDVVRPIAMDDAERFGD